MRRATSACVPRRSLCAAGMMIRSSNMEARSLRSCRMTSALSPFALPAARPFICKSRGCQQHRRLIVKASPDNDPSTNSKPPVPDTPPTPSTSSSNAQDTLLAALPGEDKSLKLPKEVIEQLKTTVFGFDTFWVTSVENYEGDGVIFQGNVRGRDPALSYAKMKERLKNQLGDQYQLFLLQDKDDKPTVIVLPDGAGAEKISRGQEIWLAIAFALGTALTTVNAANVPILQWLVDPFRTLITEEDWKDAVPFIVGTLVHLIAHEVGHYQVAKKHGADIYLPFFIPAGFGFIGSFGAITRLKGFLPTRQALLEFASTGPLYGSAVSFGLLFSGLVLSALGVSDIGVDSPAFADSLIVAVAAQAFLGDSLAEPIVQVNSLMLAGWAGLIMNALNTIPVGETDGGRIATALWGRRTGSAVAIWSTAIMAIASLGSALAFYWLILVLVLQRGPVLPCNNEMTDPNDEQLQWRGAAMLALPLLVLLPYPVELIVAIRDLTATTYF